MDGNKKEGVSVKEIEQFAKNHRFEVFFCLMFALACVFGLLGTFRPGWSIFLGMVGAIAGILMPMKTGPLVEKVFRFIFKQEKTIQFVLGIVGLVLACVVPFVVFLLVGLVAGRAIHHMLTGAAPR